MVVWVWEKKCGFGSWERDCLKSVLYTWWLCLGCVDSSTSPDKGGSGSRVPFISRGYPCCITCTCQCHATVSVSLSLSLSQHFFASETVPTNFWASCNSVYVLCFSHFLIELWGLGWWWWWCSDRNFFVFSSWIWRGGKNWVEGI